jgi:ribosomal 30S subunit maturation factor RimM
VEYFSIGDIVAVHGLKGDLKFIHRFQTSPLTGIRAVFLAPAPGRFLPYFISGFRTMGRQADLILLEGVSNREKALIFLHQPVYLGKTDYYQLASPSSPQSWVDFDVFDARQGFLGRTTEIRENSGQTLALIKMKNQNAEVPLHANLITGIDIPGRRLDLALPDEFHVKESDPLSMGL